MITKSLAWGLHLSLSAILFFSPSLHANEESSLEAANIPERVPVSERIRPLEDLQMIEEQRARQSEESDREIASKQALEDPDDDRPIARPVVFVDTFHHPRVYHTISGYVPGGNMIEIEDGSVWQVTAGYVNTATSWYPGDSLVIKQNTSWFPAGKYLLYNQITGTYVEANLKLNPLMNSPFALWIVGIDPLFRQILLQDGSWWSVSESDAYIFSETYGMDGVVRRWELGDFVILGGNYNDSIWHTYRLPYILINVKMREYARASMIN